MKKKEIILQYCFVPSAPIEVLGKDAPQFVLLTSSDGIF